MDLTQIANYLETEPEAWTLEHILYFEQLEKLLKKHRRSFIFAQFKQDQTDIKNNIVNQIWYKALSSDIQTRIKSLISKMQIHTFSLSRQEDSLRINLGIYLTRTQSTSNSVGLNLQYLNSNQKFMYYLYFEKNEDRAFIAHNHPNLRKNVPTVPETEKIYKDFLPREFAAVPFRYLLKIITEIITFYDETETVVKTPISTTTDWSLMT